jgi:hypothetical protein
VSVQVVLRCAGERTEAAARALLEAEGAPVEAIREVPFAGALRRGLEIGAESGADWTWCVDADVLIRPGALAALRAEAEAVPDRFVTCGRVVDRLMGQVRYAGNHLYRTSLIPEALSRGIDSDVLRPENDLMRRMAAAGRSNAVAEAVVGLHGHDQWLADAFRTGYLFAAKFRMEVDAYALAYWRRAGAAPGSEDLRVASWAPAMHDAITAAGPKAGTDRRAFPDRIGDLLHLGGLQERPPLGMIDGTEVAHRVEAFRPPPEFQAFRDFSDLHAAGGMGRLRALALRHQGWAGAAAHLGGRAAGALAARLDRRAGW